MSAFPVLPVLTIAVAALAAWLYLLAFRGRFWIAGPRLDLTRARDPARWPAVAAVVPARNEADVIERAVASLLSQQYEGELVLVLVDDESDDGTAERARAAAARRAVAHRLEIVHAGPRPDGWTGKMWAVSRGMERANALLPEARYVWLTDADIEHHPAHLRRLVRMAESRGYDLVSRMVRLHCRSLWERLLIPAFVFFFQKIYPFRWVADPARRVAAAAGGCILVRKETLGRIGGIERVRNALIDDCALARAVKAAGGRLWLGLTEETASIRPYDGLGAIWSMVARTAFDQLRYSPRVLAGTVLGMALLYVVPPVAALAWPWHGSGAAAAAGGAAWLAMAVAYAPTLRLYGQSPAAGLLLPVAGLLYTLMTIDSALRHWRGRGGRWKSRTHVPARDTA